MDGGVDRLSALSDDLLRRILYLVPAKEAASTSVLSRRWGSLWRSSGAVNLAVRLSRENTYPSSSAIKQKAFARTAAAALAAAEAPVTRLTLRVDSDAAGGDNSIRQFLYGIRAWDTDVGQADVVGAVLLHPKAARHVEDLRVTLGADSSAFPDRVAVPAICTLLSLPSPETLRVLDLTGCHLALAPPALPRLATLRLRSCTVPREHLQALADAAPELAAVHLDSVFFTPPPGRPDNLKGS